MRVNRKNDEMREVKVTKNYIMHPEGSVLIEFGNTKVICNATVEEKVPPFLRGTRVGLQQSTVCFREPRITECKEKQTKEDFREELWKFSD